MNTIQRAALRVSVLSSFITPFMISAVNIALPAIQKTFSNQGLDSVGLSWVATSYLLAAGATLIPMGRLADIVGRKKILGIGFAILAMSALLCAVAWSPGSLIAIRAIQGIGGGMVFGTGMAILTSVFPPQQRGGVIGIAVSAVYIGLSTGPLIGGLLTQQFGWRFLFLMVAVLGLIPLGIMRYSLKGEWADAAGEYYDYRSALLYIPSLILLIYGFSVLPQYRGIVMLVLGMSGLVWFGLRQKQLRYPLFQIDLLFQNRVFALSSSAALIHYSATFGLMFLLSLYLQYIKGLDPRTTGLVLIAQPLMMALFSPVAGKLSDRVEPRIIATIGMATTCLVLFRFGFLNLDSSLASIVVLLVILGIGFAFFSSPNMNAILGSVERRYLGIATGTAGTMRVFGQLFSMGIVTLVLALVIGDQQPGPETQAELIDSVRWSFRIFGFLCLGGVIVSARRGSIHQFNNRTGMPTGG